jgi:hypothetical protein
MLIKLTPVEFHQHFTSSLKIQTQTLSRVKLLKNTFVRKCFATLFILALKFFWGKNISAKAALKMLMKLTASVNFINVLRRHFLCKILAPKITKPNVIRKKLLYLLLYKKCACKMLMKLTIGKHNVSARRTSC